MSRAFRFIGRLRPWQSHLVRRNRGRQHRIVRSCLERGDDVHRYQRHRCLSTSYHHPTTADDDDGVRDDANVSPSDVWIERTVDGPPTRFGTGFVAQLAETSIVGSSGHTVVLATVTVEHSDNNTGDGSAAAAAAPTLTDLLRQKSSMVPLTISYQERYHGVGRIPIDNRGRRDTIRSSDTEILASRAIDRALRPLIVLNNRHNHDNDSTTATQRQQQQKTNNNVSQIHVTCSVQAHDVFQQSGHPVALAINTASTALGNRLREPVASVYLCLRDGSVIFSPTPKQVQGSQAELLFVGTRSNVVMMECSSPTGIIPEEILSNLLKIAHDAIQPILDVQQTLQLPRSEEPSDEEVLKSMGLDPHAAIAEEVESFPPTAETADKLLEEALALCRDRLNETPLKLFGYVDGQSGVSEGASTERPVEIYTNSEPLLGKAARGRREHLLRKEILRILSNDLRPKDGEAKSHLEAAIDKGQPVLESLSEHVHKRLMQDALFVSASKYGARADNRGTEQNGPRTIRPISVVVPSLPDVVHGSSIFSRGETQVLCTATLGAPRDGRKNTNPFHQTKDPRVVEREEGPYDHLPVGSLRFVRTQEALVSDLNSKKIMADRETTGDSGTFDELQRFFLHYDFPSFSKGEVPSRKGNRREIGHGKLAEKALMSVIPQPSEFPYSIRATSEVTSSNGSSSMATVCGVSLAMLDAGIPLVAPVAGVSVGAALDEVSQETALLLDITGTEDHYGFMDFKIAGTTEGVTALQLDVKQPFPMAMIVDALLLAKEGRRVIVEEMERLSFTSSAGIISKLLPRPVLKESSPRVEVVRFDPQRKRDLVGPGGAVLRQLEDRFGVELDLQQEGQCLLFGRNREMVSKARAAVMDLVADVVEGEIYEGTIIEIKDFGAIVELLRNKEGLLHVSEISENISHPEGNHGLVHSQLRVGQKIEVLCTGVDPVQGSIRLSRRAILERKSEELEKRNQ